MAVTGKASEGTPPLWDGVLELMKAAQERNRLLWTILFHLNWYFDLGKRVQDFQACVLKVNINCCKACPGKLRKKLQKVYGVSSIYIDVKQGLVKVTGNIEPTKVVEAIKKIGRKAELLSYEKDPPVAQEKLNHLFTEIHNNHIADSDSNFDDDDDDEDDSDDLHDENCEYAHHNNHKTKPRHDHGPNGHHQHHHNVNDQRETRGTPLHHHHVNGRRETRGTPLRGATKGYGYGLPRPPPARPPYGYPTMPPPARPPYGYPAMPPPARPPYGYPAMPPPARPPYGYPTMPPPARPPYGYQGYHHQQGMYARPLPPPPPPAAYYDHQYRPMMQKPRVAPPLPPYGSCYTRDAPVGNSVFHYFSDDNTKGCSIM
ncbi:heavy metal-associated isoprenylated plant protein 42-like [Quercus robur]|uniref:heavy metal-associated isoprenylated plant protein 42-like n=1 Tax=Quercus robur TaxID=38942 RepID=UPI0021630684|nr:heavy metal-associated isoprenylated plant protein 42-like [Quercus robur]